MSSEPTEFRIVLSDVPRSLASLSRQHPDGWGLAVYRDNWTVRKGTACAGDDADFHEHARTSTGLTLVSHIRQKTVGETSLENTHPFQHGRWVFAHNGTIQQRELLREKTHADELAWIRGQTDSELFFAYVVGKMRTAGLLDAPATEETDRLLSELVRETQARPGFGAFNFLLSDGQTIYAHRFGRTLYVLVRGPEDEDAPIRSTRTGVTVDTTWTPRRRVVIIASERMTDEDWTEIADGSLLRIDREPKPTWRIL